MGQGIGPPEGRRTPSSKTVAHGVRAIEHHPFTGTTDNRNFTDKPGVFATKRSSCWYCCLPSALMGYRWAFAETVGCFRCVLVTTHPSAINPSPKPSPPLKIARSPQILEPGACSFRQGCIQRSGPLVWTTNGFSHLLFSFSAKTS